MLRHVEQMQELQLCFKEADSLGLCLLPGKFCKGYRQHDRKRNEMASRHGGRMGSKWEEEEGTDEEGTRGRCEDNEEKKELIFSFTTVKISTLKRKEVVDSTAEYHEP